MPDPAQAIEAAGGWSSDTICEDTDLGLTLLELGWQAHYTNHRYGHGLLPDTFEAYKKQRHRWAYGGFQIMKKHWRRFLPGASQLTRDQKREFALGWLNWLGAESIGVVVAILNIIWVPVVAFLDIAVPDRILTMPILASFIVSVAHFVTLYRLRVRSRNGQLLGSVFAAMSVQWTVARAVGFGVIKDHLPFVRTAKGGLRRTTRLPRFLGSGAGRAADPGAIVLVATNNKECARSTSSRCAGGAEPAVHRGRGLAVIERTRSTTLPSGARRSARHRLLPVRAERRAGESPQPVPRRSPANSSSKLRCRRATPFPPASPSTMCRTGSPRR